MLGRPCTVCAHAECRRVNGLLLEGVSYRDIARQFNVSKDAVARHHDNHLPARLAKAQEARTMMDADALLSQLQGLYAKSLTLLRAAEAAQDLRTALAGVAQARACLELYGKLIGELDERPVINIIADPGWLRVRAALLEVLSAYPDVAIVVAERLLQLEVSA